MAQLHRSYSLGKVLALVLALAVPSAFATDSRSLNALLDGVFQAHVKDGYVDYPEIARSVRFHKYIEALAEFDPATLADDAEKMSFWINVYNAAAVKWRVDGIKPLGPIGRVKFFRTSEMRVGDSSFDLNSIDQLLFKFGDPRVRFATANSAYTAPELLNGAYHAETLNEQLDAAARKFINDNRKNRFSDALRVAKISMLFKQFEGDFGDDDAAVMTFIAQFVNDEVIQVGLTSGRYKIKYLPYEWSINGRPL